MNTHDPLQKNTVCQGRYCSVGLLKSGCPSCFVVGLAILPFEYAVRSARAVFSPRDAQKDLYRPGPGR